MNQSPQVIDPWGDPMTTTNPSIAGGGGGGGTAAAIDLNAATTMDNTNLILWRERERRQRSVRTLMMFLLMLLLMDGEENGNNSASRNRDRLRKRRSKQLNTVSSIKPLEADVFDARQRQDATLRSLVEQHPRHAALVAKNGGSDVERQVLTWVEQLDSLVKDQFFEGDNAQQQQQQQEQQSVVAASLAEEIVMEEETADGAENKKNGIITTTIDATQKVFHYPWNATGFYRGQWKRQKTKKNNKSTATTTTKSPRENEMAAPDGTAAAAAMSLQTTTPALKKKTALELEDAMLQLMQQRNKGRQGGEIAGVYILPNDHEILLRNDNNLTSLQWERMTMDATGKVYPATSSTLPPFLAQSRASSSSSTQQSQSSQAQSVTLTMDSGRAAFQLYSRSVPGMKELSIVDGFVKLYDSNSPGYSTRKDVLLRVRGVLIHSIGRLSLVSNVDVSRSALVISSRGSSNSNIDNGLVKKNSGGTGSDGVQVDTTTTSIASTSRRHRRLQEALSNLKKEHQNSNNPANEAEMIVQMDTIRRHVMELYSDETAATMTTPLSSSDGGGGFSTIQSPELLHRRLDMEEENEKVVVSLDTGASAAHDEEDAQTTTTTTGRQRRVAETDQKEPKKNSHLIPPWSDIVIPYPFVRDDADETIREVRTPAARRMPVREQMLESNAGTCEFEINLNVQELEWTVGAWRKLLTHKLVETNILDPQHPGNKNNNKEEGEGPSQKDGETNDVHRQVGVSTDSMPGTPLRSKKLVPDQALVMKLMGSIESRNCDFSATLNATALRTDWEATTNKAINYSFYMMLVCLTQIIILLRQLLHSQAQAAATRVSIVCIGWQTVLDALICLGHIYLSLAMQPLFTAFASVAFFKLLIFCVIEMKYMAIIIQARNSANGGQPTEVLRRQVAVLHLRIYVALFGTFILLFYVGDTHRTIAMVTLYSFWVPQIILNVVTEARTPMHKYYIYGMSFTRMIAPLYVFSIRNNFLKEVYPDAPYDPYMCQVLVLWVAFQTALLMAQSKYGARFMIPARFLPPKFDYSRPLPLSMLPPGTTAASMEMHSDSDESLRASSSPQDRSRHTTADTTRKRMKKGIHRRAKVSSNHFQESGMTSETTEMSSIDIGRGGGATSPPSTTVSRRPPPPTLDCSICYEPINIRDRQAYMLAPCEHLYHRDCLVRWMDVKMECPTCRTELPAL